MSFQTELTQFQEEKLAFLKKQEMLKTKIAQKKKILIEQMRFLLKNEKILLSQDVPKAASVPKAARSLKSIPKGWTVRHSVRTSTNIKTTGRVDKYYTHTATKKEVRSLLHVLKYEDFLAKLCGPCRSELNK